MKVSGSKIIFLVLYVDDILLATNDLGLLSDTKRFLSKHFEMKDMGEASYVIGIEIFRDRSHDILGLSHIRTDLYETRHKFCCRYAREIPK